jgi:hypothetical protein
LLTEVHLVVDVGVEDFLLHLQTQVDGVNMWPTML